MNSIFTPPHPKEERRNEEMKKVIPLILAAILAAIVLVACGVRAQTDQAQVIESDTTYTFVSTTGAAPVEKVFVEDDGKITVKMDEQDPFVVDTFPFYVIDGLRLEKLSSVFVWYDSDKWEVELP